MKTVIAALALVTLISGPTFARTADRGTVATNVSAWDADSGPQVGGHNTNCYNPYIGNWKHGYPRDDDSC
jgi:hypothetical protein